MERRNNNDRECLIKYWKCNFCLLFLLIIIAPLQLLQASPLYSRQYQVSCSACHQAPPKLNFFGIRFKQTNSLPNWESNTSIDTGDDNTAVPKIFPISLHTQMFSSIQRGKHYTDQTTGELSHKSNVDIQVPYYVKLISSSPLTENIAFYFDASISPGKDNNALEMREAWIRYRFEGSLLATLTAGQFPNSDIILDQDTRLTHKNYLIYELCCQDFRNL